MSDEWIHITECHPYNMMKMGWAAANRMPGFLIFLCCLVAVDGFFQRGGRVLPVASHDSGSEQWKALTQENFTLVHDHEFTLCIIMLSWCGEGRSLMRDLSRLVKEEVTDVTDVTALQLRYVYIDRDRPAVKFLATGRSPTIYLFRHGVPYVYGGRLTGPHVLEAVKYGIISNSNLGFPFAHLGKSEDAKLLTDSTDRSFLLLDLCGFGTTDNEEEGEEAKHRIANGSTNFESDRNNMSTRHGNVTAVVLNSKLLVEDVDEAGMDTSSLQVSMGLQSWQEVYVQRGGHDANSSNETQQGKEGFILGDDGGGSVCTELERKHFKVVYDNFTIAAAKNALSPYWVKFGYVSSKAVAVEAGLIDADDPAPWKLLASVQEPHRPPDVFDGKGDVETFVASVSCRLVTELEGEGYHQHGSASSAFLNDTPSLILFIDRSSTISEVRVRSQAALTATRDAAWHFALTTSGSSSIEEGLPVQASSGLAVKEMITNDDLEFWIPQGLEEHTQSHMLDPSDLLAFLKDAKLDSVQLQGKNRNLGVKVKAQGQDFKSLLQELLAEQEEDKAKFSDSDLLDVFLESQKLATPKNFFQENQLVDATAGSEVTGPQGSKINKEDSGSLGVGIDVEDQNFPEESDVKFDGPDIVGKNALSSDSDEGGGQNLSPTEAFGMHLVQYDDSKMLSVDLSELAESLRDRMEEKWRSSGPESGGFLIRKKQPKMLVEAEDVKVSRHPGDVKDEDVASQVPQPEHTEGQGQSKSSKPQLRFFFRDGDDLLKEKLTMSVVTPAVVIINPQTEAYFVFPLNESITPPSLITFIDQFFLGLLEETVRSEPPPGPQREGPRPPYANFDFHDQNSIPHVTANLFHHEVLGFPPNAIAFTASEATESDLMGPAWKKDVLVLFTTPWCGFCKRMELVVREVYRALKPYVGSSAGSCHDKESYCPLSTEHKEDVPVTDSLVDSPDNVEHSGASNCDSDRGQSLPVFLQMDCTLNDCDFFLHELLIPGETYPAFVLYPAERKHAPVIYRGAPDVHSLHEFIATYGLASTDTLCRFTGTRTNSAATINNTRLIEEVYPTTITIPIRAARKVNNPASYASTVSFHTTDATPDDSLAVISPAKTTVDLGQPTPGMLLLATAQLDGKSFIFEKSVILILQASVEAGVRGLILNKPISWNHIQGLQVDAYGALRAGPLTYGGPVSVQNHPFFVLTRRPGLRNFEEVVPGVFCREEAMSEESIMDITESENLPMKDLWLFLGCTSWTWAQLEGELAEKTWQLQDYRDGLIQWPAEWVA